MNIVYIFSLLFIYVYSNSQNCIKYRSPATNFLSNFDFSTTSCPIVDARSYCIWNKANFISSNLNFWYPEPEIRIQRAYFYSNFQLPAKWGVQLAATFNTCIKYPLINVIIGRYQLKITYVANYNITLANSKFQVRFNDQFIGNITPTSYNISTDTLIINVNQKINRTQLIICGVGQASYLYGAMLSTVQMFYLPCIQCNSSYGLVQNVCTLCNQSCRCDGWTTPKNNNICNTICGDNFIRGKQQCDDGNLINNDGCSSICKIQTCQLNCSCNGLYKPLVNGSCKTLCGDSFKTQFQQCDDGNTRSFDGCDKLCKLQSKSIAKQQTQIICLIVFFFGFRIAGLQALNVLQNFQILLKRYNIFEFQISEYIHGYTNPDNFIFPISEQFRFLKDFNFMFLIIIILIIIIFSLELFKSQSQLIFKENIQTSQSLNFKIHNSDKVLNKNDDQNLQKQNQMDSIFKKDTLVKTENKLNIVIIFLKRMLFLIFINCLSIYIYSFINSFDISLFSNSFMLITLCLMSLLLIVLLFFCSKRNVYMGQLQQKIKINKRMIYWLIIIFQKIIFSILCNYEQLWSICTMIGLKVILIFVFLKLSIFLEKVDNIRNLMIQFLHVMLIITFTINQYNLKYNENGQSINQNINYIYYILISIVLITSYAFILREIYKEFRNYCKKNNQIKNVKEEQIVQNQQTNYPFKKNNNFDVNDVTKKSIELNSCLSQNKLSAKIKNDIQENKQQKSNEIHYLKKKIRIQKKIQNKNMSMNKSIFQIKCKDKDNQNTSDNDFIYIKSCKSFRLKKTLNKK